MHIPDGLLDPKISTGLIGAATAVLGYCFAKVREAVTVLKPAVALATAGKGVGNMVGGVRWVLTGDGEKLLYKMGLMASLVFAAQMFDFPIGQGTSGHLLGGVLAGIILGPFAGAIVLAAVLGVQSLFFADGGLFALGANIVNLAVIGAIVGYYCYFLLKKILPEWAAVMFAAWLSVVLASLACALELGLSGKIPLAVVIPTMVKVHFVIGIAEGIITLALVYLFRSFWDWTSFTVMKEKNG